MRFSAALAVFAATFAIAAPMPDTDCLFHDCGKGDGGKNGGGIAACETSVAAEQVACIKGCGMDAACITKCSTDAAAKYTACATG